MFRQTALLLPALIACVAATPARALEYRSLAEPAIAYDACSTKARPLFILRKGTPVEVIVSVDRWTKIREQSGGLGCIESTRLGTTAQIIVTAGSAAIHQAANEQSAVVFTAARDLVLEVTEKPVGGWIKVRHADGQTGYISIKAVWGI